MPKRPCALEITKDSVTIISADKFGDVYSLPLIASETAAPKEVSRESSVISERPFKPAANELTIHSQRNRKALANQKRQALTGAEKTGPTFEHSLLLGHVSLLTDVKLAYSNGKNYIITADRDEHIRVSRGTPQTHIIEGFCLGHKEFISRICIPKERPDLLISGGGDNNLFVWRWESGELISGAELKSYVGTVLFSGKEAEEQTALLGSTKIAVSGIFSAKISSEGEALSTVIVTCEAVPALFVFSLTRENTLQYKQTLNLPGNALSVVTNLVASETAVPLNKLIVSIDNVFKPGSTSEVRTLGDETATPLLSFHFGNGLWVPETVFEKSIAKDIENRQAGNVNIVALKNLLYGIENLRKRDNEDRDEGVVTEVGSAATEDRNGGGEIDPHQAALDEDSTING
ncbi:hypothetical protein G7Y89_g12261 [Cudoniella acicularis]|uniref:Transfer RNA methyltransferase 82 n=1 Tax=Cudoniella acicularis TaxID=354080 RepID=A0A8H4VZC3_9HELO|nr:hypothetical protein G7Y89_g12261 [Cudoniella acicularis]